jgi:uncharacterized repeat protein (TIGR01451 family)
MTNAFESETTRPQAEHLPLWWRCVLIAVAMVILNACAEPVTRKHLTADKTIAAPWGQSRALTTAPIMEQVVPSSPAFISEEAAGPGLPNAAGDVAAPEDSVDQGVTAGDDGGIAGCEAGACVTDGCDDSDPYGPVLGPGDEYLCDGGDYGTPAGVHADWSITGLEQEDAISHYDTVDGRVLVTPSNRVCIYAPRFAVVRRVVQPIAHEQPVFVNQASDELSLAKASLALPPISQKQRHAVAVDMGQQPANLFRQRQHVGGLENLQATMDTFASLGAYANLTIIRTGEVSDAEKALVERAKEAAITLTGAQAPQVAFGVKQAHAEVGIRQPGLVYQTDGPDTPKLRLLKLASCGHAQPGEVVEFTLRYDNIGDQKIGNVTIVDNLTTRLEYVPESAKSSVDADFITQSNDAGSLILRWEIRDPVKPGEGGVLRFKVKVR